jgi:DNA modification methylase
MRYLIKLITPRNGTVLDMFAGSGTTLCAAKQLGMNYIGIEQNIEYIKIAEARIEAWDVLEPTEAFPDCLEPFENANNKTKLIQQNLFN